MSRVGKMPIAVPQGVDVAIDGEQISVKGAHGHAERGRCTALVKVKNDDGKLTFAAGRRLASRPTRCRGTMRALVANMVNGVSKGFEKQAEPGRRGLPRRRRRAEAEPAGRLLAPGGQGHAGGHQGRVTPTQTEIVIKGADRQVVGQVAAEVRAMPSARALQGQGHPLCRRAGRAQRDQEEVRSDDMLNKKEQRLRRSRQTRSAHRACSASARLTVSPHQPAHLRQRHLRRRRARCWRSASTAEKPTCASELGGDAARAATPPPPRWSASASPRRPRPPASRRSRSTARASPTTAASRRWPKPRAKPACSSKRPAAHQGQRQWQSFNPARRPKATTTA